jgi:deazaflavin-dependent oxidoreductase (nitroreductase family)
VNGTVERMIGDRWTTRAVVRVYRATGGRVFGTHHGRPVLLLTTVGADTGAPCTTPVEFARQADRFLLVGEGGDGDSCWPENLLREPSARVEIGSESWEVRALPTSGAVFVLEPVS